MDMFNGFRCGLLNGPTLARSSVRDIVRTWKGWARMDPFKRKRILFKILTSMEATRSWIFSQLVGLRSILRYSVQDCFGKESIQTRPLVNVGQIKLGSQSLSLNRLSNQQTHAKSTNTLS